jgi:hypothetical protein
MTKTDKIVDSFLTGMVDLSGEKSKILCLHSDEKIQALKDKLNEALTIPVVVDSSVTISKQEYEALKRDSDNLQKVSFDL